MANVNTRQNDGARADPDVVFDDHRRRWRYHVTLREIMLVVVKNEGVMTEKAVAPNTHQLVRRNGGTVIDEGMIAHYETAPAVANELKRYDVAK
jgi:hypothetical protein